MPSIIITTTIGQANRLAAAVGVELGLRGSDGFQRDATNAEVKYWFIAKARNVVHSNETRIAQAAISSPSAFDPT